MPLITNIIETFQSSTDKACKSIKADMSEISKGFSGIPILKGMPSITQKVFESFSTIVTKGKGGLKHMGSAFSGLSGFMTSYGPTLILTILEKMRVLEPIMALFGALLEFMGGQILTMLMPLFQRFTDILTSPEFMDLLTAVCEILVAVLLPTLEMLVITLEVLSPYFPYITQALRDLIPLFSLIGESIAFVTSPLAYVIELLYGSSPGLIPGLQLTAEVLQNLVGIIYSGYIPSLQFITQMTTLFGQHMMMLGNFIQGTLIGAMQEFNTSLRLLLQIIREIKSVIPSGGGGGILGGGGIGGTGIGGGGGSKIGSAVKSVAKKIKKTFGFQEGTPYVPASGWWHLEEGETVIPAGGRGAGVNVIVQGHIMKEDIVDYMVKELAKRRALGMF